MKREALKVCLLGASFDVGNGVAALTGGAIQTILHNHPDAEISLLDYAKEGKDIQFAWRCKTVAVRLVNIRFSKRLYLRNNIARLMAAALILKLMPSALRRKVIGHNPWLRHVDDTDVFASIAGGDSFSDFYGLSRFFYVASPQLLVIWMGKRLILLPQTLGPFKSWTAKVIAQYILLQAKTIYSRDRQGLKLAAAMLGKNWEAGKVRFCYDLGFAVDPIPPAHANLLEVPTEKTASSCRIGLNVSGLLAMGGYNRKNMFALRVEYNSLIRSIIRLLIECKNASVLLVPHVIGSGSECDSPACERVYMELKTQYGGQLALIRGNHNYREIKSIIGQCDFFIGSRMHACIAAVSQCVPCVSIAYSDKFMGVMETLGAEATVADPRIVDEEAILRNIDEAFEHREEIHQQLGQKMSEVRKRVLSLFDDTAFAGSAS